MINIIVRLESVADNFYKISTKEKLNEAININIVIIQMVYTWSNNDNNTNET